MSEIKLLPCPFCGGEANVYDDEYNHYAIGCKLCCDVTPITTWEDTVEKASTIWNTRKPMERILTRLEEKSEEHDEARRIAHGKGLYNVEEIQESKASCFMEAIEIVKEEGGIE